MSRWLLALILSTVSAAAGLSQLEALSMIETGNNDWAVGRAGEVSRFQIRPSVWRQYSQSTAYGNKQISSVIAEKHVLALETLFRTQTGREPTDFDLYVLWNAGPGYYERIGFSSARVNRVIRDRAQRYLNLRNLPERQRILFASQFR